MLQFSTREQSLDTYSDVSCPINNIHALEQRKPPKLDPQRVNSRNIPPDAILYWKKKK